MFPDAFLTIAIGASRLGAVYNHRELAETVEKEADVNVYYLDTLVRGADEKDSYLDGMQKNINILKTAFGV